MIALLQASLSGGSSTVFATSADNTGMSPQDSVAFEQFKSATNTTAMPYAIRKQSFWDWLIHKHSDTRIFSQQGHTAGTGSNAIASYRDEAGNKYHVLIKDIPKDSLEPMKKVVQNNCDYYDDSGSTYEEIAGDDDFWKMACGCIGGTCKLAELMLKCVFMCCR